MASATLSSVAGAFLSPLRDISLDKLINYLWDYLSSPSSSDEAENHQQLEDSLEALEEAKMDVKLMQTRIMRLFEKHKQNERVVGLHNKLKDVDYEIQDLESDMKYLELETKVEEINKAAEADTVSKSSSGLKRLFGFYRPTAKSCQKKRRLSTSPQSLNLSPDDDVVKKISRITNQINSIESRMKDEIKLEEWFDKIKLNGVYDPWEQHHLTQNKRVTTSSTNERKLYGRDHEIEWLIEFLKEPNINGKISVVPVVGMGGIGKTTLAQFVFNNTDIENRFDKKAWICVSEHFDRVRITKEIVDSLLIENSSSLSVLCGATNNNLDLLERELKKQLTAKKFLLVLDDVWSDEWQQFLILLQSTQVEAVKIIVTCRDPKVLGSLDVGNKIVLEGLSDEDYWLFFMNCAFADKNPDNYPQTLHDIGRHIVAKLKGSPLAAKTVGRLLGRSLTKKHWKDVLESDMWKLEADAYDIMPALALSYYHLPQYLQLCFTFCSVFPKDYVYDMDNIISMWIAHGYVHEAGSSSKTVEDTGEEYCHELIAMCFFEGYSRSFKMHDLMHDLAQSVSHGEICIYENGKGKKISSNVRHLCAQSLIDLGSMCKSSNLRTLVLYRVGDMCAFLSHEAFKRIRVLIVFDANIQEFPDAIAHLKHLQYLDLKKTNIKSIPESLCNLYQLRVLKLPRLHALPSLFHNLINLRDLRLFQDSDEIYNCGRLVYRVQRGRGYEIAQLRSMNELRGALSIESLENIDSIKEAMKGKLKEKHHIKDLDLSWTDTGYGCKHDVQEEVLEGLQPHHNVEQLRIKGYAGFKYPSWLMTLALQRIELNKCKNWERLPTGLGLLPSLQELNLIDTENITVEFDDSVNEMFPSLQWLQLKKATLSFEGLLSSSSSSSTSSSSITTGHRKLFPCLQHLIVEECNGVNGPWPLLSALKTLRINACPGLQGIVPKCLQSLNSLTSLEIKGLKVETTDNGVQQQQVCLLPKLRVIEIECCQNMAVLLRVPSLENLSVSKCSPVSLSTLGHLSFLTYISLQEMEVTMEEQITPMFPSLHTMELKKASLIFQNMSPSSSSSSSSSLVATQNHNCFPRLTTLRFLECNEVNGLQWRMFSVLTELCIRNSLGLDSQLPGCLNGLSSLSRLELSGASINTFPTEIMATLHALLWLQLEDCPELISLEGLQALPSLKRLFITKCPKLKSMCMKMTLENGVLLPNLLGISIDSCQNLESLPACLSRLPLLKQLSVIQCPKFHSLPESGLPSSLERLNIIGCDTGLMKRCQQEGSSEWLMIQHIPKQSFI